MLLLGVQCNSEHVGKMTDTHKQKAEKASEMPIKCSLFVGNMQIR